MADNTVDNNEKLNLLWRTFNNVVNAAQRLNFNQQIYAYRPFYLNQDIIKEFIPKKIINNANPYILINGNNVQFTESSVTTNTLDNFFYVNNALPGERFCLSNCSQDGSFAYLEFVYRQQLRPALTSNSLQSWIASDPVDGDIRTNGVVNLLRDTIAFNYDDDPVEAERTYNYRMWINTGSKPSSGNPPSSNNWSIIGMYSNPDYWLFENKSGFIQFYGGELADSGNDVTLTNFCLEDHWNGSGKSPPFISYIRYIGQKGITATSGDSTTTTTTPTLEDYFDTNLTINGTLNINNSLSFNDISNQPTIVLNNSQLNDKIVSTNASASNANFFFFFKYKPWPPVFIDGHYTYPFNNMGDTYYYDYGTFSSSYIITPSSATIKFKIPPRIFLDWNYNIDNINFVPEYKDLKIDIIKSSQFTSGSWINIVDIPLPDPSTNSQYLNDETMEFNLNIDLSSLTTPSTNINIVGNIFNIDYISNGNTPSSFEFGEDYKLRIYITNSSEFDISNNPQYSENIQNTYNIVGSEWNYLFIPENYADNISFTN